MSTMCSKKREIVLEEFEKKDVLKLKNWGVHEDLRYIQYGFDLFYDDGNFDTWYEIKTAPRKKLFAIKEGSEIRGYISLRDISSILRSAVLGISIDPNYLSEGIGKCAMEQFLELYFTEMQMRTLHLKVSLFNRRAIRLYESLGFVFKKTRLERFENQMHNFKLLLHYEEFLQFGDAIYTEVSSYAMNREDYERSGKQA
ncbi:MAG: GNAT family N-acetyltransferase [Bacillota bacterium]|nr:GNAT family N-acetyltransferase [Bacillota bacterium]